MNAAIDVSDGLSLDLDRMMQASGTAAVLDLDAIPIHPDAVRMSGVVGDGRTPLAHALGDGEDFELLLAMPPEAARAAVAAATVWPLGTPLTVIGEVVAGTGLFQRRGDGQLRPLAPTGFLHDFHD